MSPLGYSLHKRYELSPLLAQRVHDSNRCLRDNLTMYQALEFELFEPLSEHARAYVGYLAENLRKPVRSRAEHVDQEAGPLFADKRKCALDDGAETSGADGALIHPKSIRICLTPVNSDYILSNNKLLPKSKLVGTNGG